MREAAGWRMDGHGNGRGVVKSGVNQGSDTPRAAAVTGSQRERRALQLAEAVRAACLAAAREGYEQAGMSGLCHEGAMEMSLDSIRRMDLREVIASLDAAHAGDAPQR